jgi:hypothetical protein
MSRIFAYRALVLFGGMAVLLALGAGLPACSDDSDNSEPPPADAAGEAVDLDSPDLPPSPDLGVLPDLPVQEACASEWRDAINPQSTVSEGAVTTTDLGDGVQQTTIDASAGGMSQAHKNPYVYLSLADGSKVEIDDVAAKTSTAWDLAFKRSVIRVNGGDSGAGQGAVAIIAGTPLEQVTAIPDQSAFTTDDFLDESCNIERDPINNILTAFAGSDGVWYEYDTSAMKLTPNPDTYVVRTADGQHVKVYIDSYYSSGGAGAHYTIRWSPL